MAVCPGQFLQHNKKILVSSLQARYDRMGTHAAKGKGMGRDHAFIYTIASQLPDAAPEHLGSVKQLHSSAVIGAIKLGAR